MNEKAPIFSGVASNRKDGPRAAHTWEQPYWTNRNGQAEESDAKSVDVWRQGRSQDLDMEGGGGAGSNDDHKYNMLYQPKYHINICFEMRQ